MKKMIMLAVVLLFICGCGTKKAEIPYYFIAIHNEPGNQDNNAMVMQEEYTTLIDMAKKADEYNIKLTIMMSPQLADYLASDATRLAVAEGWVVNGHELAAHHHGPDTYNWDGYSMYPEENVRAKRAYMPYTEIPQEKYHGTMDDFMIPLRKVNPDIKAGCMNDEKDKNELSNGIVYDTCSGLANYGTPGTLNLRDDDPKKGVNEYVTVGIWNGIQRKWLTHFQITEDSRERQGEETFSSISSGAYGAIVHSSREQALQLYKYMEFLHAKDPKGKKSRTVSQIIDQKLLPEKTVSEETLKTVVPEMMNFTVGLNGSVQMNQTVINQSCMPKCMNRTHNLQQCQQQCAIKRGTTVHITTTLSGNRTELGCMEKCMSTNNNEQQCKQQCAPSNDSCMPKCMEIRQNQQQCQQICTSDDTCMPKCMSSGGNEQQCLLECAPEDSDPCMVQCMIKNNNKEQCLTECAPDGHDGDTCMPECMANGGNEEDCLKTCAPEGPEGGDATCMPNCMSQYNDEDKCKEKCAPEGEAPPDSGPPPQ